MKKKTKRTRKTKTKKLLGGKLVLEGFNQQMTKSLIKALKGE